jgi:FixJ family two-component response regulator
MTEVLKGRLNKQIAGEIGVSEVTVKAHRGQVMRKIRPRPCSISRAWRKS